MEDSPPCTGRVGKGEQNGDPCPTERQYSKMLIHFLKVFVLINFPYFLINVIKL